MFAFASMGIQPEIVQGHGPYLFKVHGQVRHLIGPAHPQQGQGGEPHRQFAQFYMIDTDQANRDRLDFCQSTIMLWSAW